MKKIKQLLLLTTLSVLLIASITACASVSQHNYDALKKEVRATLQCELDKGGTSVSYAVMQNGKLLVSDAVGYLDGTKKAPATTDTLYNIGSVSKVYCAAAAMKLVDDGKIKLGECCKTPSKILLNHKNLAKTNCKAGNPNILANIKDNKRYKVVI